MRVQRRRVRSRTAPTNARREGIGARRTAKVLSLATALVERPARRCKRSRSVGSSHRALAHVVGGRGVHRGGVPRVGDNGSASATGAATEAADVLGKIVVAAHVVSALPVASPKGDDTRTAHAAMAATTTVSSMVTTTHMRRRAHHVRGAIPVSIAHLAGGARIHGRVGAAEAGSPALEVGEPARWAGPVTRSRPILAGRERG